MADVKVFCGQTNRPIDKLTNGQAKNYNYAHVLAMPGHKNQLLFPRMSAISLHAGSCI